LFNLFYIIERVPCIDGRIDELFTLCAHLLTWMGDIPALNKSLNLCSHNSYKACHFCMLEGICHLSNHHIYYPSSNTVHDIRNYNNTINMAKLIDEEANKTQKNKMIKETGNFF
jgi:hypothetical protein